MEEFLIDEFYEKMDGANFEAYGILGSDDRIHTLGDDKRGAARVLAAPHRLMARTSVMGWRLDAFPPKW